MSLVLSPLRIVSRPSSLGRGKARVGRQRYALWALMAVEFSCFRCCMGFCSVGWYILAHFHFLRILTHPSKSPSYCMHERLRPL